MDAKLINNLGNIDLLVNSIVKSIKDASFDLFEIGINELRLSQYINYQYRYNIWQLIIEATIESGYVDIMEALLLLEPEHDKDTLYFAAKNGFFEVVEGLLNSKFEFVPLEIAIALELAQLNDNEDIVNYLNSIIMNIN